MQEQTRACPVAKFRVGFVWNQEQVLGEFHDDFAPIGIELMGEFEQPGVVVREDWGA